MKEGWKDLLKEININTLILAGAILLAVIIYCFGTRYQIVGSGEKVAYQVDRITGRIWFLMGSWPAVKINHESPKPQTP